MKSAKPASRSAPKSDTKSAPQSAPQTAPQFTPDPAAWFAQFAQYADAKKWATPLAMNMPAGMPGLEETLDGFGLKLDPEQTLKLQQQYAAQLGALYNDMLAAREPAITDRRLSAPAWQSNQYFAFQAAAYQLNGRFMTALAESVQAPAKIKQRIRFAVEQMIDALSPANFLATNPDALQKIIDTRGESLTKGITQMIADMGKGRISQTDENAFEIGKDVATTAGAVVFENDLFQLIQYAPLTRTVHQRPLLIVPPCINKFYILDLQPQNSLVRYTVEQGHTVFLVSWRNVDASMGTATWDDYIEKAAIEAIHTVQAISGQAQISALGFCVGGTILSSALAVLYGRGEKPLASLTLLTAFLDFADTGAIDVYIDDMQLKMREQQIGKGGLLAGRDFSSAFSSLRPNDLLWNYVESNYLKGEAPPAFDLLYWNADSTNVPGPMFCYYLRQMYLENRLRTPGALTMAGQAIDLGKIDVPAFIYASREDHIVPWMSAFESMKLLNPKKAKQNRFVLGASGHIAGVINPPAKNKRSYWTNDKQAGDAQAWLDGAAEHAGSWWPQWAAHLAAHGGKQVAAPRKAGSAAYPAIEPAPGRYVKVKAG